MMRRCDLCVCTQSIYLRVSSLGRCLCYSSEQIDVCVCCLLIFVCFTQSLESLNACASECNNLVDHEVAWGDMSLPPLNMYSSKRKLSVRSLDVLLIDVLMSRHTDTHNMMSASLGTARPWSLKDPERCSNFAPRNIYCNYSNSTPRNIARWRGQVN